MAVYHRSRGVINLDGYRRVSNTTPGDDASLQQTLYLQRCLPKTTRSVQKKFMCRLVINFLVGCAK